MERNQSTDKKLCSITWRFSHQENISFFYQATFTPAGEKDIDTPMFPLEGVRAAWCGQWGKWGKS